MGGRANTHTAVGLRGQLEHELRRPVPDELWNDLVEKDYIRDALDAEGWGYLVNEAKRLLRFIELGARGRVPRRVPAVAREPTMEAHGRAVGAWAARYGRGDMSHGRTSGWLASARGYLGGTFPCADAVAHLQSPAWSLVPLADLVARPQPSSLGAGDSLRIRSTVARVRGAMHPAGETSDAVRIELELTYKGGRRGLTVKQSPRARSLTIEAPERDPIRVLAAAGTLNERLLGLATQSQWGPLTVAQTLWLILTDEAPQVSPLTVDVRREIGPNLRPRDIITIEAEPWVPFDALAAAYRGVRAELLSGANRPPRLRSLELARFLAEEGWGLSITKQMRLWNARFPHWEIHDRGNFAKDATRATALILGQTPTSVVRTS